jgi:hypothetical protein
MPEDILIILKVDDQNSSESVRRKFDGIWGDTTKSLLLILGSGAPDIEKNARDAAGNNPAVRRAVWIQSTEILTKGELDQFTDKNSKNVICSASMSRTVGSWRDAATASHYSEVSDCFSEAGARS